MRRYVSLVLLALFATLVLAPAAMAQMNDDQMMDDEQMMDDGQMMDDEMMSTSTATATSMSTASAMSTASMMSIASAMSTASAMGDEMTASATTTAMMEDRLPGTGGPSLAPAFALMAGLMLMGSGVAAFALVRRTTS